MNWNQLFARRTRHMKRTAVREILKVTARPEIISFAGGLPAAELFPVDRVRHAVDAVLARQGGPSLQYAETEGLAGLRDWVAARFSRAGCRWTRDNVLITSGAQQGLDLIGRVFLDPGDRVVVENPTYLALLSAWRPLEVQFVPVASDQHGLCVDALEPALTPRPKLIYLVPNFQNPQGTTLTLERRQRLVELLSSCEVPLVEDNPYGELRYSGNAVPNLLDLEANDAPAGPPAPRVIYTGTFSKILMPGLRVGWVIASTEVIDKLVQAKQAADLHTASLSQHLVLELLQQGFLAEFVPLLCRHYRERRDVMLAAMARHFPPGLRWTEPDGGLFLLVTLPPHVDAAALLPAALARQVAFVPGEEFHLDGAGKNTLRLNFSNATPERIALGIERLGQLFANAIAAPAPSLPATSARVPQR